MTPNTSNVSTDALSQNATPRTTAVVAILLPRVLLSLSRVSEILGSLGLGFYTARLLLILFSRTGVDHGDFPKNVLRGLEAFLPKKTEHDVDVGAAIRGSRWKIPDDEIAKRRDLRKSRIFTIDPSGARDLDDALSITPLADGTFEIGVHIADVTYFVRPNSDLDREARRRATTVYLVQQARRV